MSPSFPLILASASPRRIDLLRRIGVVPDAVEPADMDESPLPKEMPRAQAARLALAKAKTVAARHPNAFVLAGDTVVACGRRVLPKPVDAAGVAACLRLLSGRRHRVYGGVALIRPDGTERRRLVVSSLSFHRLTEQDITAYAGSGEGIGKAGGYAIQGAAEGFVRFLSGSYSNIVGLPLFETRQMLIGGGYVWP